MQKIICPVKCLHFCIHFKVAIKNIRYIDCRDKLFLEMKYKNKVTVLIKRNKHIHVGYLEFIPWIMIS